nr:MAG TPA: Endonuclease [Caudoviricetes sp.]
MSKYHSKKTTRGGVTFDSRMEARRYDELLLLQQAGKIKNLRRQVKFVLIPTQREPKIIGPRGGVKNGKLLERECSYVADFVYSENGKMVVEDAKGVRTKDYIIKRKLMLRVYGIRIREV